MLERTLDEAVDVFCRVFAGPPHLEDWRSPLADPVDELLADYVEVGVLVYAMVDGRIAGFAASEPGTSSSCFELARPYLVDPDTSVYLAELAVLSAHRGLGLGAALCQELLAPLRGRDVFLRVASEATDAQRVYGRLGFSVLPDTRSSVYSPRMAGYPEERNDRDERFLMAARY
jgi:ribosomal protein S18 acetylase RimI-like enzyme